MSAYLGRLHAALHDDFNELLQPSIDMKEFDYCSMFFMTLGLYGLPQGYVATCKILGSPVDPTTTSASFVLLRILQKNKHGDTYIVYKGNHCHCMTK